MERTRELLAALHASDTSRLRYLLLHHDVDVNVRDVRHHNQVSKCSIITDVTVK